MMPIFLIEGSESTMTLRALSLTQQETIPLKGVAKIRVPEVVENNEREAQSEANTAITPFRPIMRQQMIDSIDNGWMIPELMGREEHTNASGDSNPILQQLESIKIPRASFSDVPLSSVIESLSLLSEEYDPSHIGINLVLIDAKQRDPHIHLTLRNLSLKRNLDFITESVGYEYEIEGDSVVVRPFQGLSQHLETQFFPVSRSTLIRLTGLDRDIQNQSPLINSTGMSQSEVVGVNSTEESAVKSFLQRAGIPFDRTEGASLALADGQLIVTHSPRYLKKVANILRRYSETRQVEIEARFLEVQQSDLDEMGFNWFLKGNGPLLFDGTGQPILDSKGRQQRRFQQFYQSDNRSMSEVTGSNPNSSTMQITGLDESVGEGGTLTLPVSPPQISNSLDVGSSAGNLAELGFALGQFNLDVLIRALTRKSGSDLLSAPRLTVLSGKKAEIVVAQELRYPQHFSDIDASVGRGESGDAGSAGVAVTAGTPQDFAVRNIGVEMEVTPSVEEDDSISLLLEPKVTEFEGFVEYGGPSVAIASGQTVTVPSGFFQPIFSVRRVRTEVTIWDGATVVMGGLTREQTVTVKDKVPVLGDIPLIGRLFRSESQATQKRNLLIFVTANLVSPGGCFLQASIEGQGAGSYYQMPVVQTPAGSIHRSEPSEKSK
jgi:general secretion pathway protein D